MRKSGAPLWEGKINAMRPRLTASSELAVMLFNKMGGTLDWSAVPILFPIYGVADIEAMLDRLETIRNGINDNG